VDWFDGRTAVVTGAAHGIGRAIAHQLDALGAAVVAVDRDVDALEGAHSGTSVRVREGDLATDDTADLARAIDARFGPVELLVNNVGVVTGHPFLELEQEHFDRVLRTNLRGPWFFTRALVEGMVERARGGAILFLSSLHDHIPLRRPHYSASKGAIAMLVRELAWELGPHGIRVNAISPGAITTSMSPDASGEQADRMRPLFRLRGRAGEPDDVARMAAVLLSDEWAGYVTGANVPVDGGLGLVTWARDDR
jgi:NAD(P)-dependent dehydrogenase (short-subunit alcohol dehydrogenase family)